MAVRTSPTSDTTPDAEGRLCGQRIAFVGKLTSMTHPEACALVTGQGAEIVVDESMSATMIVIGDNCKDLQDALSKDSARRQRLSEDESTGRAVLLRESELWHRLGLVEQEQGVQRLYTPAMLAELLDLPVAAIRRWHRIGALVPCRCVRRLPYFDFTEVAVARHLATLLKAGCSLRVIDRKLVELQRAMPEVARPLCDPSLVVSGQQLFIRRGDELAEPGGQLLIDFDKPSEATDATGRDQDFLAITQEKESAAEAPPEALEESFSVMGQLQYEALEWEDQGELGRAAEIYRTMLVAGGPSAEIHFALADVLYRLGDLSAARERYYAAVEQDEEYVEARANLGSVLAENNELELAVAAFQGALAFHPDYADVHYHLANTLERLGRHEEARQHWETFLNLAPESPWAEAAREHLGECPQGPEIFSAHES